MWKDNKLTEKRGTHVNCVHGTMLRNPMNVLHQPLHAVGVETFKHLHSGGVILRSNFIQIFDET